MKMELSVIERLRGLLVPQGTAPIVQLRFDKDYGLVNYDFIKSCIDELEQIPMRAHLGIPPTNLEKLAYMLLCESAYIDGCWRD